MLRNAILIILAVVVLCCLAAAWVKADDGPRPTYLWFFSATACPPCREMKADIARSGDLQAAIGRFAVVWKLDYDDETHRAPFAAADVGKFPTVIIYDQHKVEMRRLVGHPSRGGASRLLEFLRAK